MKEFLEKYADKLGIGLLGLATATIMILLVLSLTSCTTPPDKKDYIGRPEACYDFVECLYLNQKNPDKSVCADYAKECRAYGRYNFCKDEKNRPTNVDFTGCQLWLNQK
jgi:hypothetical protein